MIDPSFPFISADRGYVKRNKMMLSIRKKGGLGNTVGVLTTAKEDLVKSTTSP